MARPLEIGPVPDKFSECGRLQKATAKRGWLLLAIRLGFGWVAGGRRRICRDGKRSGKSSEPQPEGFAHLREHAAADRLQPFLRRCGQLLDETLGLLVELGHGRQEPGI
jgi:hypothetical protein